MTTLALIVALALIAALTVLQVLVAIGMPFRRLVWGGKHRVLLRRLRIGSLITVPVYLAFAALLMSRAGALPGGSGAAVVVTTWVLFAYLALSILANAASRSRVERWTMAPTSAVLATATFVIALG